MPGRRFGVSGLEEKASRTTRDNSQDNAEQEIIMGIGGISIWQLLIILAIVIMLFGTKRLRTMGSDLGSAVKGFRKSMSDDGEPRQPSDRRTR